MDMTPPGVVTIAGDAEVDHAIATLVLAFVSDPVARWKIRAIEPGRRSTACDRGGFPFHDRLCAAIPTAVEVGQ